MRATTTSSGRRGLGRVFVAMSGGVDSSVAAALLVRDGYDVTGVTMQLLPEGDAPGGCCSFQGVRDARRVCDDLGIPHYVLNVRDVFSRDVVEPFCAEYAGGRTPNPCIACNDKVKFVELWRRVALQGADALATGHYARIVRDEDGVPWLARGLDRTKDQSYFLYRMDAAQLDRTLFPDGDLTKAEVRALAAELSLVTAERPESQEVCFVPDDDHASFVGARHPEALIPGPVIGLDGCVVGTHRGLARYTVGQRRGLGIAAPEPLYVVALRPSDNALVAGPASALAVTRVGCGEVVWRGPAEAEVTAQVRYRQEPVAATANVAHGVLELTFAEPVVGVAPGQAAVCYNGDVVMGGGVVEGAA